MINKKTSFSLEGFLISRNNSDGTPISPDRVLGFYGTVDLSGYASDSYDCWLGVRLDDDTEQYQEVDFSAAVSKTAVTVQEMVDAINAAGFTGITASVDTSTSRLLVVSSTADNFLQVFSVDTHPNFAAELDFGQGQTFGGLGAIYYEAFDNARTLNLAKRIKDAEDIENEAGDGTFIEVTIGAILKGYNPVITTKDDDYEIKHLIQGGTWDPIESTYRPPKSSQTSKPTFSIIFFCPTYGKGSHERENMAAYLRKDIYSMTGLEADTTHETKTLQEISYNCKASEWTDENDTTQEFYQDQMLTPDQFDALGVEDIHPITDIDT